MSGTVALLTDSTWSMPPALLPDPHFAVVPLHVSSGAVSLADTPGNEQRIREVLSSARHATTSQPSTGEIRSALEALAEGGATHVVAIHLSAALSGTCDAVRAVGEAFRASTGIPVDVVDTRSIGAATGFAVLAARRALDAGGGPAEAVGAAEGTAHAANAWVTVQDLRYLQRGGRLSASHALIGTALGVRPILRIEDGKIVPVESARGAARARRRLVELVVEGASTQAKGAPGGELDIAVHHTGDDLAAEVLTDELRAAAANAGLKVRTFLRGRISPVLAVHGGPGALAVVTLPAR